MYQSLIFSHFTYFVQKILIECQFYPKTTCYFKNGVVIESEVKLVCEEFSVRKRQSKRKPKFDTPKWELLHIERVSTKTAKVKRGNKWNKWSFPPQKRLILDLQLLCKYEKPLRNKHYIISNMINKCQGGISDKPLKFRGISEVSSPKNIKD